MTMNKNKRSKKALLKMLKKKILKASQDQEKIDINSEVQGSNNVQNTKYSISETSSSKDEASGNENVKTIDHDRKRELKEEYINIVLHFLSAPSPSHTFFCEVLKPAIIESVKNNEILFTALLNAVQEAVRKPTVKKNALNQFKKPVTFMEFMLCEDQHFQEMLHLSRTTVKIIINNLKGIPYNLDENAPVPDDGPQPNEPLDKIIYLVLWYLRSKNNKIEDAVEIFELGTIENARILFSRGIVLLLKLKEDSGIVFPTTKEREDTCNSMSERFGLAGIIGIVGFHLVKSESGKRLLLQGLINGKLMFSDLHVSYDTRPKIAFQLSPLRKHIRKLDHGFGVVCAEPAIPEKLRYNLFYPVSDVKDESNRIFNMLHRASIDLIKQAFSNLFNRFERLNFLETCDPAIIMASCILYNYAEKYNDLTPL